MRLATTFSRKGVPPRSGRPRDQVKTSNGAKVRRARKARQLLAETHPEPPPAKQKTHELRPWRRPTKVRNPAMSRGWQITLRRRQRSVLETNPLKQGVARMGFPRNGC